MCDGAGRLFQPNTSAVFVAFVAIPSQAIIPGGFDAGIHNLPAHIAWRRPIRAQRESQTNSLTRRAPPPYKMFW
jgi:hypothetical protein